MLLLPLQWSWTVGIFSLWAYTRKWTSIKLKCEHYEPPECKTDVNICPTVYVNEFYLLCECLTYLNEPKKMKYRDVKLMTFFPSCNLKLTDIFHRVSHAVHHTQTQAQNFRNWTYFSQNNENKRRSLLMT